MFIPILAFHEAAHALVAHWLGDDTAKNNGRLTLNPFSHIDPVGTLLIPGLNLIMPGTSLIGWGRPVPVDSRHFRNWRRDEMLVAMAGPIANLILALIVLGAARWLPEGDGLRKLAATFAFVSVFLAVFNLIPLPPLDGWQIMQNLFKVPAELIQKGGIWWYIALLLLINLPPFISFLYTIALSILQFLTVITVF